MLSDEDLARKLAAEPEVRRGRRREVPGDAELARAIAAAEEDGFRDDVPMPSSSKGKKRKSSTSSGEAPASSEGGAAVRTAVAERAAVTPLARHVDRTHPCLVLALDAEHHLVSPATYRILQWGATGHRDILRLCGGTLHGLAEDASRAGQSSVALESQQVRENRDEWDQLPFVVPSVPPKPGHVYVTHEANDKINVGSELYHRIYIEEGTPPKQVTIAQHEERLVLAKEAERASKVDRKKFGETAPLGVRLSVVKTSKNGDCFFDALCKAYRLSEAQPHRDMEMWRHAFGRREPAEAAAADAAAADAAAADAAAVEAVPPTPSEPPTVRELRGVVAAHFPEEAWLIGQSVGGESFAFVVAESLDLTRANVASLAEDAGERAYWADESAIAVVQRYLGVRLLIFNPSAAAGNRCHCAGETVERPGVPKSYILLAHTHRANKMQHYELYSRPGPPGGPPVAVFHDISLPAGVKRAFADVCIDGEAGSAWRSARDPELDGEGSGTV